MAEHRHLNNAPVREAIIAFRVNLSPDAIIGDLESVLEKISTNYSDFEPLNQIFTQLKIDTEKGENQTETEQKMLGYRAKSTDGKNIIQLKMDGFTFSELSPYTNWPEFSAKAKELWDFYCAGVECDIITRSAVRYVNHIEIPLEMGEDFSNYLVAPPEVPEGLPQGVGNFLTRVAIQFPEEEAVAQVAQAQAEKENPELFKFILDIDVFTESLDKNDKERVWDSLSSLRDIKNKIFFSYLTEKTLRLYQ